MAKRIRLKKDVWVSTIFTIIGYAIPTIISALLINRQSVQQQNLLWPIFILLSIGAFATAFAHLSRLIFVQSIAVDDQLINSYLLNTVNFVLLTSKYFPKTARDPYQHLRANVMLLEPDGNLHIAYTYNMSNEAEKKLIWTKGYGVCGVVAQLQQQLMVDLTLRHRTRDIIWQYPSRDHENLTKDIKTVVCTPLINKKNGQVIGVLNVDSNRQLAELKLSQPRIYPKIMNGLLDYANLIAQILTKS